MRNKLPVAALTIALTIATLCLAGCSTLGGAGRAETEVRPGRSATSSYQEERRPSRTEVRVVAPPAPLPPIPVHVRVVVPPQPLQPK